MQGQLSLLYLAVLCWAFVSFVCADDTISVPSFNSTACASKKCVGFVEDSVDFYVYKHRSYDGDDNTIEGDEYLHVKPLTATFCKHINGSRVCDVPVNLQYAIPNGTDPELAIWNDANGLSLNYTISNNNTQLGDYTILIKVYMLKYATRVVQDGTKYRVSAGDFVIEYNWNWNATSDDKAEVWFTTLISHANVSGLCVTDEDNSWHSFQFSTDTTDCADDAVGYSFAAPNNAFIDSASVPVQFNSTTGNSTTAGLVTIGINYSGSSGTYTMLVFTGSNAFFIWMITLVVTGGLLVLCTIVGVVGWFIREKKRKAQGYEELID